MSEEKKVWLVSEDEQFWNCSVEFNSKEQAQKQGAKTLTDEYGYDGERSFFVGTKKVVDLKLPEADTIRELIVEENDDILGEWSECWQGALEDCQFTKQFIDNKLIEIKDYIIKRHPPKFFTVDNVEEVSVEKSSDKDE